MTDLTPKQKQIVDTIIRANPDGTWLDFDQLIAKLPYSTTKASMHFSLRALIAKGVVEKKGLELRRGQERRILAPTARAYELRRGVS